MVIDTIKCQKRGGCIASRRVPGGVRISDETVGERVGVLTTHLWTAKGAGVQSRQSRQYFPDESFQTRSTSRSGTLLAICR